MQREALFFLEVVKQHNENMSIVGNHKRQC